MIHSLKPHFKSPGYSILRLSMLKKKHSKSQAIPSFAHPIPTKTPNERNSQTSLSSASISISISIKHPVTSSPVLFHVIHTAKGLPTLRTLDGAMRDMLYFDMAHQWCVAAKRLAAGTASPTTFEWAIRFTGIEGRLLIMNWEEWEHLTRTHSCCWGSPCTKFDSTVAAPLLCWFGGDDSCVEGLGVEDQVWAVVWPGLRWSSVPTSVSLYCMVGEVCMLPW